MWLAFDWGFSYLLSRIDQIRYQIIMPHKTIYQDIETCCTKRYWFSSNKSFPLAKNNPRSMVIAKKISFMISKNMTIEWTIRYINLHRQYINKLKIYSLFTWVVEIDLTLYHISLITFSFDDSKSIVVGLLHLKLFGLCHGKLIVATQGV